MRWDGSLCSILITTSIASASLTGKTKVRFYDLGFGYNLLSDFF